MYVHMLQMIFQQISCLNITYLFPFLGHFVSVFGPDQSDILTETLHVTWFDIGFGLATCGSTLVQTNFS